MQNEQGSATTTAENVAIASSALSAHSIESIGFYAAAFFIGFAMSLCRLLGETERINLRVFIANSAISGFLAFGGVAVLVNTPWVSGRSSAFYLTVAVPIGLLSEYRKEIAKWILKKTTGIDLDAIDKARKGETKTE